MNYQKLKIAEQNFLMRYPQGFESPEMQAVAKKHKLIKMTELAKENFSIEKFEDVEHVIGAMGKLVSQSSLVSIFEKPKLRDALKIMNETEKQILAIGLKELLHGNQASGFSTIVQILKTYQIAKWPIITVVPYYFKPNEEVLIKPNTVKGIINFFEMEGLKYSPNPTFEFYSAYREEINKIKKEVSPLIQAENAGFCGFLMMSLERKEEM